MERSKTAQIALPPKLVPVFSPPRGTVRYRGAYGGRGSGKSLSFAIMAALFGYAEPLRILCTRELQVSIKESMFAELKRAISMYPFLQAHYDIGESFIRGKNGTEFLFRGLRHNISTIRSTASIDIAIVEEAEDVPETSWLALFPTIRNDGSEIWVIWNPGEENSPVDKRFRKKPPKDAVIAELQYFDNPSLPDVLDRQRIDDRRVLDDEVYAHVWEGAYRKINQANILSRKVKVDSFTPNPETWDGPYHGLDYGFSNDPLAAVKCWVHDKKLWIEYECGGVGVDIDQTPELLMNGIPGIEDYRIFADNARPESTSYLVRHGLPMVKSVDKWKGSVEDGIAHLLSYDTIVVHPRCRETINETRLYSYKTDKLTGEPLPIIVDAYNHYIDAIRYSLAPLIKNRGDFFVI